MAGLQRLGRIQEVEPRKIWPDEESRFTPWLSDNLDLLGDALDLSLTFVGREVPVGPYSADIIAQTAHDHLRKLITYAASRNASYLVWIATEFREEHRSALDWLNRTAGDRAGYFGVVLRCIQIGDSEPAPEFLVVCRPNIYGEAAREKDSGLSETGQRQLEFWTELKSFAEQRKCPLRFRRPAAQYWSDLPLGKAGIHLSLVVSIYDRRVGCKLYIGTQDARAVLQSLLQKRGEIESELGPLEWPDEAEGPRKHLTVRQWNDIDASEKANWPQAFQWLLARALAFRKVFQPIVTRLPAKT